MKATLRAYEPSKDYSRIRGFLMDTFAHYGRPFNWTIERWSFRQLCLLTMVVASRVGEICRHAVIPCHSCYSIRHFGIPTQSPCPHRDELPLWERTIGVWESEGGDIVGVAHSENEEPGEAWIQIHPDYTHLYDEMVTYAEEYLADRVGNIGYVKLYVNENTALEQVARAREYRRLQYRTVHLEHTIGDTPAPQLPPGFTSKSVLQEDDPHKRSMTKAIAFGGNYAPSAWLPAPLFAMLQRAPDYRSELDLFIVAPNGDYASFCTIWVDEANHYANFEPVGTHAEYQGMGLGRALLMEGFRRMAQHGARRSYMDSGNEFYRKVGFRETPYAYSPWIKHFPL